MSAPVSPEFPFAVDDAARDQVCRILRKDGREEAFLRVGIKGGGCSGLEYLFALDAVARETDLVWSTEGVRIHCDPKSARFLAGATLTFSGNLLGGGLRFENPNAERSCGCGTSFTPKR